MTVGHGTAKRTIGGGHNAPGGSNEELHNVRERALHGQLGWLCLQTKGQPWQRKYALFLRLELLKSLGETIPGETVERVVGRMKDDVETRLRYFASEQRCTNCIISSQCIHECLFYEAADLIYMQKKEIEHLQETIKRVVGV